MRVVIVTLAEYQTIFWIKVAHALGSAGIGVTLLSFDDRSTEMARAAAIDVVAASDGPVPDADQATAILREVGIDNIASVSAHERFAFGLTDTLAMRIKLARAVRATNAAIDRAGRHRDGPIAVVQEVGGFLSVIGSFHAARARDIDNWFIEPSFFRGRMILTKNGFAAPLIKHRTGSADPAMSAYLEDTVAQGAIVIPEKDSHHYGSAIGKILNRRNGLRLIEKFRDKYLFGKQQEFGFIGHHVRSHLAMIANSWRQRSMYMPIEKLGRYVYYPLHVPGDMALTIRSPQFLDQIALIDYICRHLPDGVMLAVKEHPAMVGAIKAGRLRELDTRYDNFAVLAPTLNNYTVMRGAEAIVTVNSKSGAEAGLLGKRPFVLGDAFYRDAPFAIPVAQLTDLPAMLAQTLSTPEPDPSTSTPEPDPSTSTPEPDPSTSTPEPNPSTAKTFDWFGDVWAQSKPGELFTPDDTRAAIFAASLRDVLVSA